MVGSISAGRLRPRAGWYPSRGGGQSGSSVSTGPDSGQTGGVLRILGAVQPALSRKVVHSRSCRNALAGVSQGKDRLNDPLSNSHRFSGAISTICQKRSNIGQNGEHQDFRGFGAGGGRLPTGLYTEIVDIMAERWQFGTFQPCREYLGKPSEINRRYAQALSPCLRRFFSAPQMRSRRRCLRISAGSFATSG
jgi:hypothetical protein